MPQNRTQTKRVFTFAWVLQNLVSTSAKENEWTKGGEEKKISQKT